MVGGGGGGGGERAAEAAAGTRSTVTYSQLSSSVAQSHFHSLSLSWPHFILHCWLSIADRHRILEQKRDKNGSCCWSEYSIEGLRGLAQVTCNITLRSSKRRRRPTRRRSSSWGEYTFYRLNPFAWIVGDFINLPYKFSVAYYPNV